MFYTKGGTRYLLVASEARITFLWLGLKRASQSKDIFPTFLNHINEAVMTGITAHSRIIK